MFDVVRQPVRHRAIDVELVKLARGRLFQPITHPRRRRFPPPFVLAKLSRLAEPHNSRQLSVPERISALLSAAVEFCAESCTRGLRRRT